MTSEKKRRIGDGPTADRMGTLPKDVLKQAMTFSTLAELVQLRRIDKLVIDSGVPLSHVFAALDKKPPLSIVKKHGFRADSVEISIRQETKTKSVTRILKRVPLATSLALNFEEQPTYVDFERWIGKRRRPLKSLSVSELHPELGPDLAGALISNNAKLERFVLDTMEGPDDDGDEITADWIDLSQLFFVIAGPRLRIIDLGRVAPTLPQLTGLWTKCTSLVDFTMVGSIDLVAADEKQTLASWLDKRPRTLRTFDVEIDDIHGGITDRADAAPWLSVALSKLSQLRVFKFLATSEVEFDAKHVRAVMEANSSDLEELTMPLPAAPKIWGSLVPEHCPKLRELDFAGRWYFRRDDDGEQMSKWLHAHPNVHVPKLSHRVTEQTLDLDVQVLPQHCSMHDLNITASHDDVNRIVAAFLAATGSLVTTELGIRHEPGHIALSGVAFPRSSEAKTLAARLESFNASVDAVHLDDKSMVAFLHAAPRLQRARFFARVEGHCDFSWVTVNAVWIHPAMTDFSVTLDAYHYSSGSASFDAKDMPTPPSVTKWPHTEVQLPVPRDFTIPIMAAETGVSVRLFSGRLDFTW